MSASATVRALLLAAGLVVAAGLVALPGLRGGWIYDDLTMAVSPWLDDASDLPGLWRRTSADYLAAGPDAVVAVSGQTWRPLTMATLAVTHIGSPTPLAHHLVSWVLHGLLVGLLAAACVRDLPRASVAFVLAFFALHPAGAETWVWINGRSDLVAGLLLAALAAVVAPAAEPGARQGWRWIAAAGLVTAGALSKETFLPAAGVVVVAPWLPTRWADLRAAAARGTAVAGYIGAYVAAAAGVLGLRATLVTASPDPAAAVPDAPRAIRLLAEVVQGVALPAPRSMRWLAWDLHAAVSHVDLALIALIALAVLALAARGNLRVLALGVGALVCLLPVAVVANGFWLGFDRYLTLPMLLGVLAVAWGGRRAPDAAPPTQRAWLRAALLGATLCAPGLWLTASAYREPPRWAGAMITTRPDDPTGYLLVARQLNAAGQFEVARDFLGSAPFEPRSPVVTALLVEAWLAAGGAGPAALLLESQVSATPDDPMVQLSLLALRLSQNDLPAAIAIAEPLAAAPATCGRALSLVRDARAAWDSQPDAGGLQALIQRGCGPQ